MTPDPRQSIASRVDLGLLQSVLQEAFDSGRLDTRDAVGDLVIRMVQRVKSIKVWVTDGFPNSLNVQFRTKDDLGYYGYEFAIHSRIGFEIRDVPVLPYEDR